jgi:hypothetical protein
MTLHAPQVILLSLVAIGTGIALARYGERKTDSYDIFDVVVSPSILICLLYWGGFFG